MREKTHSRHMGYSYRLAARVLLYAPSHRQDSTYHGLCYTSRGAMAGPRNSSMGPPPHEESIRRPSHHERTLLPGSYISLLVNIVFKISVGYANPTTQLTRTPSSFGTTLNWRLRRISNTRRERERKRKRERERERERERNRKRKRERWRDMEREMGREVERD